MRWLSRPSSPPVLTGRDDDANWRLAPTITRFRQHDRVEDGDPRYRTEAKVAYALGLDARHRCDKNNFPRADIVNQGNWLGLQFQKPTKAYRRLFVNLNQWNDWNTEGLRLNSSASVNINGELPNQWRFWTGYSGTAYTFARLNQRTTSVTARVDYTLTPTLSFQLYAQPFVTSGDYSNLRRLSGPLAEGYEDRFVPFTDATPDDFNFKQSRSNSVLRWEYRPGSVLLFVWQQGREDFRDLGTFNAGRDYGNLFRTRSDNTFLITASYWFSMQAGGSGSPVARPGETE